MSRFSNNKNIVTMKDLVINYEKDNSSLTVI